MSTSCGDLALETMRLEQDGRVLTAFFSAPPLHFAGAAFIRDLDQLTKVVDRDPSVGAVVLTGTDGRFLTHADPRELGDMMEMPSPALPMGAIEPFLGVLNAALCVPGAPRALERFGGAVGKGLVWGYRWKRTILRMNRAGAVYLAAINGPTLGGGHEIALACDLRYVADAEHIRLGQFEILVGNIPGGGGTQRLPGILGTGRAIEHMLEGAPLTAPAALDLGLVQRLMPEGDLLAETQATAARLASRSPTAVAAIKRSVYFGTRRSAPRGLDMELSGFLSTCLSTTRGVPAPMQALFDDIDRHGDTPFLADPEPWIAGTRLDETPPDPQGMS